MRGWLCRTTNMMQMTSGLVRWLIDWMNFPVKNKELVLNKNEVRILRQDKDLLRPRILWWWRTIFTSKRQEISQ